MLLNSFFCLSVSCAFSGLIACLKAARRRFTGTSETHHCCSACFAWLPFGPSFFLWWRKQACYYSSWLMACYCPLPPELHVHQHQRRIWPPPQTVYLHSPSWPVSDSSWQHSCPPHFCSQEISTALSAHVILVPRKVWKLVCANIDQRFRLLRLLHYCLWFQPKRRRKASDPPRVAQIWMPHPVSANEPISLVLHRTHSLVWQCQQWTSCLSQCGGPVLQRWLRATKPFQWEDIWADHASTTLHFSPTIGMISVKCCARWDEPLWNGDSAQLHGPSQAQEPESLGATFLGGIDTADELMRPRCTEHPNRSCIQTNAEANEEVRCLRPFERFLDQRELSGRVFAWSIFRTLKDVNLNEHTWHICTCHTGCWASYMTMTRPWGAPLIAISSSEILTRFPCAPSELTLEWSASAFLVVDLVATMDDRIHKLLTFSCHRHCKSTGVSLTSNGGFNLCRSHHLTSGSISGTYLDLSGRCSAILIFDLIFLVSLELELVWWSAFKYYQTI